MFSALGVGVFCIRGRGFFALGVGFFVLGVFCIRGRGFLH